MKLIEKFCRGKRQDQELNEDAVFISEDLVAVLDGCTSRSTLVYEGRTPGRLGVDLAISVLERSRASTLQDILLDIDSSLKGYYEEKGFLKEAEADPSIRISLYIALYSRSQASLLVLGDTSALVGGRLYTHHKKIDVLHEDYRAMLIRSLLQEGLEEEEIRRREKELRDECGAVYRYQKKFQNSQDEEYGYSVLDGFLNLRKDSYHLVEVPPGSEVILASDGYPEVLSTLEETEKKLSSLLLEDPLCYRRIRSVKGIEIGNESYDDRSYIRFIS